jgi:hypothetical protein
MGKGDWILIAASVAVIILASMGAWLWLMGRDREWAEWGER